MIEHDHDLSPTTHLCRRCLVKGEDVAKGREPPVCPAPGVIRRRRELNQLRRRHARARAR